MITPQQLIQQFNLQPHPEGGWYKETYKSTELLPVAALPQRFTRDRSFLQPFIFCWNRGIFRLFIK
ncbi:MAG: cupin domain-containing protein [Ferruginibacter sp.]|nr:cupin domain-containing protein [Ferruginibacter sp.]